LKNRPEISVIIPVYNAALFLHDTLDSVLKQSFQDFELICVDDGSTDGSLDILKKYASKDSRVTIYCKPNGGIPAIAKNYGIDRSVGQYVFLLDADDYLSPDVLKNMYLRAKETCADAVLADLVFVSENGTCEKSIVGLRGNRNIVLTNRQAVIYSLDWTIHNIALWRGNLIRKLRLEEFGMNSDEYSGRVLLFNSNKIAFCEGSYFYLQNTKSTSKKISVKIFDQPFTTYRLSTFLKKNSFDEKTVRNAYLSTYKQVIFFSHLLISEGKKFNPIERADAEEKIKRVYDLIDKRKVREYLSSEKGLKKHVWIISTVFNWNLLKWGSFILFSYKG
jgi:glycosyltransferase involved in cell wall biosynthesis